MTKVSTFTATIYVGTRERYTTEVRSLIMAREWLQQYANQGGICVTLTPLEFIYKDGAEPGLSIGLINYPRFPELPEVIRTKALFIAEAMLQLYRQAKVSVVFPDETVMLEAQ